MSFNCDLCESNHIFGVRGICNETEQFCECPEGFSGEDDWTSFDSCHVNEDFRNIFQVIVGTIALLAALSATFVGYFIVVRYKEVKRRKKKKKRSTWVLRDLCFATVCLIGMTSSVAWYEFQFVAVGNVEPRVLQTIPFGLMNGFMVAIICFLLLAWVHTLPPVDAYGELFEFSSFIKKYPNRVYHVVSIGLIYSLFRIFFTAIYFVDETRNFSRLLNFLLIADAMVSGMIVTFFIVYAYTLKRLLKAAIKHQTNRKINEAVLAMLESSLSVTNWSYKSLAISTVLATATAGVSMVDAVPHEYLFIGIQFIIVNFAGGMIWLRLLYSYVNASTTTSNAIST